jgi:hypothetical protein
MVEESSMAHPLEHGFQIIKIKESLNKSNRNKKYIVILAKESIPISTHEHCLTGNNSIQNDLMYIYLVNTHFKA